MTFLFQTELITENAHRRY